MQCLLLTALFAANHQVRLIQLVNQTCKSDYKISTPWIISYEIQCTIVYSFLSFTDTQFFSLLAKLWQSLVVFFLTALWIAPEFHCIDLNFRSVFLLMAAQTAQSWGQQPVKGSWTSSVAWLVPSASPQRKLCAHYLFSECAGFCSPE